PTGAYGKAMEVSKGKDTITGHWEIAGIKTMTPFKTYPDGFPAEFIKKYEERIGVKVLGNYPESGTKIIEDLGSEHEKTGCPIVYTSADSVFQIAANTDVIPLDRLYEICKIAREMLVGEWACGRVIARPYIIDERGKRTRTSDRHDYAVSPPEKTMLDIISEAGKTVYAVGKINDIFNGQGISQSVHTEDNMDGVNKTLEAMAMDFDGLIFTNLVDFDSKYGHRRDPEGYAKAIEDFDLRLPEIFGAMKDEDVLILCADHGNDPVHSGFDHTREYVPILAYGKKVKPVSLGGRESFGDIGATVTGLLGAGDVAVGQSFADEIME
ncbi:MAG: phosphopentomutase, partial [Firmicutes bacterium]|nr:phosphopentomutase [Bacillota bacterium]